MQDLSDLVVLFCVWWDYIEGGCFVWLISQVLGLTLRCRRLMEPNFRFEAQSCLLFLALDLWNCCLLLLIVCKFLFACISELLRACMSGCYHLSSIGRNFFFGEVEIREFLCARCWWKWFCNSRTRNTEKILICVISVN